nr:putative reverse transcriptase domain-containing protein [Tanacetum cinerariifolium]GFB15488.1 putative reverse transcriptase domain-containing protein [Tanacetum cinerariifolium]
MHQKRWIELLNDYECEIKYHRGKANVVTDALSKKERLKMRRVRTMSMAIHSGLKTKILEAQREVAKDLKAPAKWLQGLDTKLKNRGDGAIYFGERKWIPSVGVIRKLIMDEAHTSKLTKSAYFLAIREYFKMERLPRIYFNEIVARHGTDGQSERTIQTLKDMLRECVMDFGGNSDLQVPLEEIKIDDKLYFVEEPVEIADRQVKKLKRSWIPIVKVRWDSQRGAEFTWEREDQFKAKYPHLFATSPSATVVS